MESMTLMTAYSASSLTPRDVFVAGALATLVTVTVTLAAAYLYWPLLGLKLF
jgi:di/tricarboxylate transporter